MNKVVYVIWLWVLFTVMYLTATEITHNQEIQIYQNQLILEELQMQNQAAFTPPDITLIPRKYLGRTSYTTKAGDL